jgi:hypothetical protein
MICKVLSSLIAFLSPGLLFASEVYGQRFCEIVESRDYFEFKIYHKENCPLSWWQRLSVKQLQNQNHVSFIHLNGPRIWLVDEVKPSAFLGREVHHFSGLNLNLVGKFKPDFNRLLQKHGPYTDYHMHRDQVLRFHKGREILELISPKGQIYVIHSLSLKHQAQSPDHLEKVITYIHPPKGWQLKHGILNSDHELYATGHKVHVLQDELENTYQQTTGDWLKS